MLLGDSRGGSRRDAGRGIRLEVAHRKLNAGQVVFQNRRPRPIAEDGVA
jgi:hypothetical protein